MASSVVDKNGKMFILMNQIRGEGIWAAEWLSASQELSMEISVTIRKFYVIFVLIQFGTISVFATKEWVSCC